jgi:hypothetical protein
VLGSKKSGVEEAAFAGCKEATRLWEVAARAATAAVTTAATAATAAAAGAKTSTAFTEATAAAVTAARAAVAAAKAAEAGELAAYDTHDDFARAACGLKPRRTAGGASGSGSGGSGGGGRVTPTTAEPAASPRATPSPQTATTKERSTARAAAADEAAKTEEGARAAATHAPDRDTLVKKLHTFAKSAMAVIDDDIESWVVSEFSGDVTAITAAAEGGDAKAQLAMWSASNISAEENSDWLQSAMGQGCLNALPYSGLMFAEGVCGQNDEAKLEVEKEKAMTDLQMPFYSERLGGGSARHGHAALHLRLRLGIQG